jgi:putative hemolysin
MEGPLLWILATLSLLAVVAFALLRLSLLRSLASRVLPLERSDERRARLAPLLERPDALATSAGLFRLGAELAFAVLVLALISGGDALSVGEGLGAIALAVPLLVLVGEVLPAVLVVGHGDRVLIACLPAFHVLQWPIAFIARAIEGTKHLARQALDVRETPERTRRIVEDLREAIVDSEIEGGLDDTEREIIENVMEFHDVDVASVMTPRTEICAVDLAGGIGEAIRVAAATKHSRLPVYDGNLDAIVGIFSTRDVLPLIADGRLEACDLRSILRPVTFVPETKRVSDLLGEFRRQKAKLAVVLDEYGGTAGLVTMGDILGELVGELRDEYDDEEPAPIRRIDDTTADVDATEHVSDVNEALDLELPEEDDYETIGGLVLARLGHFPSEGETLVEGDVEITVTKASDRRVLEVRVRRLSPAGV